jgi:hypothetical protein
MRAPSPLPSVLCAVLCVSVTLWQKTAHATQATPSPSIPRREQKNKKGVIL